MFLRTRSGRARGLCGVEAFFHSSINVSGRPPFLTLSLLWSILRGKGAHIPYSDLKSYTSILMHCLHPELGWHKRTCGIYFEREMCTFWLAGYIPEQPSIRPPTATAMLGPSHPEPRIWLAGYIPGSDVGPDAKKNQPQAPRNPECFPLRPCL